MNCYPFIEAERVAARNVARACELLKVSRAAYYASRAATPGPRARGDAELAERIRRIHERSRCRYGAPRVQAQLRREGLRPSRKRVARLMRGLGLRGRAPRRWTRTTVADPAAATLTDLVRRNFNIDASAVNSRWCGDITYIPTGQGWLFLATVLDLASRRVVGFAFAEHLRTELVSDALRNAVAARDPKPGVVFHADRGCQYTSADYTALARRQNIALSYSRPGQCWDNAVAESFFATLKGECLDRATWPTRDAARAAAVDFIAWYNGERLHSALGYRSPSEFESTAQAG